MSARRGAVMVLLCGAALSSVAPIAQADSGIGGLGGCAHGGLLSGVMVPGTGSAGQGIRREADVWGCFGPLLPGIVAGHFSAELPWNALDSPTLGQFAWSDGSVSRVIGQPNGLWTVVDGPATGHTFRFGLTQEVNVWWYHWANTLPIESVSFLD